MTEDLFGGLDEMMTKIDDEILKNAREKKRTSLVFALGIVVGDDGIQRARHYLPEYGDGDGIDIERSIMSQQRPARQFSLHTCEIPLEDLNFSEISVIDYAPEWLISLGESVLDCVIVHDKNNLEKSACIDNGVAELEIGPKSQHGDGYSFSEEPLYAISDIAALLDTDPEPCITCDPIAVYIEGKHAGHDVCMMLRFHPPPEEREDEDSDNKEQEK